MGVIRYLMKPVDPDLLRTAINELRIGQERPMQPNRLVQLLSARNYHALDPSTDSFYALVAREDILYVSSKIFEVSIFHNPIVLEDRKLLFLIPSELPSILQEQNVLNIPVHFGLSRRKLATDSLEQAITEADEAYDQLFIDPNVRGFVYHTPSLDIVASVHALRNAYLSGDKQSLKHVLKSIAALFYKNNGTVGDAVLLWQTIATVMENTTRGLARRISLDRLNRRALIARFHVLESMLDSLYYILCQPCLPELDGLNPANSDFRALLKNIYERYSEKLTLTDLSVDYGINISYCCELFRRTLGMTFSEYLTAIRMERARMLLLLGERDVRGIAKQTGYSDYHYFLRCFKKYHGLSPRNYFACQKIYPESQKRNLVNAQRLFVQLREPAIPLTIAHRRTK